MLKPNIVPVGFIQKYITSSTLKIGGSYLLAEVESRTQGSRPRPRPRTQKKSEAKAKAKDSPSEDRTSRGQGQECSRPRPRTKDTGASVLQKKSLQKFFSGDLQFVGVPRIYWDKPKPQIE